MVGEGRRRVRGFKRRICMAYFGTIKIEDSSLCLWSQELKEVSGEIKC